jgi:hypothetical protein
VPGRNPAEAIANYIRPLQQSLSCFTRAVIRPSGYDPEILLAATFNQPNIELLTKHDEVLRLSFIHTFSVIKPLLLGSFKVRTRSYLYIIEDDAHREIVGFHWHPETTPEIPFPHLHIYEGAGAAIRQEIRNIHFRTDQTAFEEFALMLVDYFDVVPERSDAAEVLRNNLRRFKEQRSWSAY